MSDTFRDILSLTVNSFSYFLSLKFIQVIYRSKMHCLIVKRMMDDIL